MTFSVATIMAEVELKYGKMTLKAMLKSKISYRVFHNISNLIFLLELIPSVTSRIKTTACVDVELFSIILSFNHGCHTNKVSNFGGENLKQT